MGFFADVLEIKKSSESSQKVELALLSHAYGQNFLGVVTSIICASVVLVGLLETIPHRILYSWYGFLVFLNLSRLVIAYAYKFNKNHANNVRLWHDLFILSSLIGGLSWGLLGWFIFTAAGGIELTLSILVMVGISAGAVAILSAVLWASFAFLTAAIAPFMIKALFFKLPIYSWFDLALFAYYWYLLVLCVKTHRLIKESVQLRFENDALVQNLSSVNKKLAHMATHDPLTKIDNRRLFYVNVAHAIKRAKRNKELMGLLFIDLDGFKEVNDSFGHNIGDELLLVVVERLRSALRASDIIARIGGDEFTVILEQIHEKANIGRIAHETCMKIAEPIKINEFTMGVSASIGISIYPVDGTDTESLVKAADDAMYHVKTHGRNNFHFSGDN